MPLLDYCSEAYCPLVKSRQSVALESPLRTFTSEVFQKCGVHYNSYRHRLDQLNIHPVYLRIIHSDLVMCYKIMNGLTYFPNSNYLVKSRSPRDPYRLINICNQFSDKNSYFARIAMLWNKISFDIPNLSSLDSFKQHLSYHSRSRTFVNEIPLSLQ
mgnify:CR=1 FL=1